MDVVELVRDLGARDQGLVTRQRLRAAGASEGGLARAISDGRLHRPRRGVLTATPLAPVPRHLVTDGGVAPAYVAQVRAVLLGQPRAVAAGRTAAVLRGWGLLVEPVRTVELAVEHARSSLVLPGVRVQRRRHLVGETVRVLEGTRALRLEPAVVTLTSMAAARPLTEVVVAWDSALRCGAVTREALEAAVDRLHGRPAMRAGRALQLCDGRAGSVLESVHRVQLVLAGLTGFTPQLLVRDLPALRVDFAWTAAGLVVEVDGARWHTDPARDRARDNALAGLGWRVLRYTWAEVLHDEARVIAEVTAALSGGGPRTQLVLEGLAAAC